MPAVAAPTRKEESIENLLEAVRANAVKLLEAVRKLSKGDIKSNVRNIKSLLTQLRRLERNIYRRVRRDKNLSPDEKEELEKILAELQAIYKKDRHELKEGHMSSLRVLAGEEETITEEAIRKLQEDLQKGTIRQQKEIVAESFKELFGSLQTGDIIGISFAGINSPFGEAARVFEMVTGSRISHVGIIDVRKSMLLRKRKIIVIEAAKIVSATPIEEFITEGNGRVAIYRYNGGLTEEQKPGLTEEQKQKIITKARSWVKEWHQFWKRAVKYDYSLTPGEEELYCSELVDEAYQHAGIKLSSKYYSVDEIKNAVSKLFEGGAYELFGHRFETKEKAFGKVAGPEGYYKPNMEKVKFRKSVISPQDIIINGNTDKIFDNLS